MQRSINSFEINWGLSINTDVSGKKLNLLAFTFYSLLGYECLIMRPKSMELDVEIRA